MNAEQPNKAQERLEQLSEAELIEFVENPITEQMAIEELDDRLAKRGMKAIQVFTGERTEMSIVPKEDEPEQSLQDQLLAAAEDKYADFTDEQLRETVESLYDQNDHLSQLELTRRCKQNGTEWQWVMIHDVPRVVVTPRAQE